MGFGSLQHMEGFEVHLPRAMQTARYVPPSGFGYPRDGLRPRIPSRFCFTPAALMGFALRRFHLPERITTVSAATNPHTVSWPVFSTPKCRLGPTSLGFWAHAFRKCLAIKRGFRPSTAGASLGIRPSRASQRKPRPELLPVSSRTLRGFW